MLGWLKKKLREWLVEDDRIISLDCLIDGKVRKMVVGEAHGLRLHVYDGGAAYLIDVHQAADKHLFWKAWGQRNTHKVTWEDGTPFTPE